MSAKIDKILKSDKQNSQILQTKFSKVCISLPFESFFLSRTHIKDSRTRTPRCRFGSSWFDEACGVYFTSTILPP